MSLDTRARHAVRGLQDCVVLVRPVALPTVTRRHRLSLVAGLAGALAIAFASIALASMLPDDSPSDTATINPSTIPDPEIPDGELVVLPEGGGGTPLEGVHQKNTTSSSIDPYTQFYGAADPGTVIIAASAYGDADLVVGDSGEFFLKVYFEGAPPGISFPVTLTAGDVVYDFSFTSLWDPQNVDITAHQAYGQSDSATPFEKFYGTAAPGTHIAITSAYGSAEGEAWDEGEWYLKVWFEGAPVGEPFDVNVTVGDESFAFSFLWLFDDTTGEFSVTQEGTSSSSASPYTRFIGTGPAGTHVLATSEYGAADLEVGESGEFNLKVWFSGAPAGVKFPITLKVNHEFYGTFYFTSNFNPDPTEVDIAQYNSESWEPAPWIKFHGTAPAGTTLVALSEYGSADMTVGESGEVYFKLYFSTLPPAGETFPVTLKVNGSVYGVYSFTSWSDGSVDVTVNQHNTETDSPEPYVKFYGTAPVGTEIQIISPYGSTAWTTESVEWLNKLWFSPLPPAGESFTVTVKVNGDVWDTYTFTSYHSAELVANTADNVYGSCSENPPFDVYFGTAPEGTSITISSAYGGASTTAGGDGGWEKQVFFSGAPLNEAFTVTVDVGGEVFYFGMVVTSP